MFHTSAGILIANFLNSDTVCAGRYNTITTDLNRTRAIIAPALPYGQKAGEQ